MAFVPLVLVLVLMAWFIRRASSGSISKRFRRLGDLTGKTRTEIVKAVGRPTSVSSVPKGALLQWQARGYHIAIRFDEDGVFDGITHEFGR